MNGSPKDFWSNKLESYGVHDDNVQINCKKMSMTTLLGHRLFGYPLQNIYIKGDDLRIKELNFETPTKSFDMAYRQLAQSMVSEFNIEIDTVEELREVWVMHSIANGLMYNEPNQNHVFYQHQPFWKSEKQLIFFPSDIQEIKNKIMRSWPVNVVLSEDLLKNSNTYSFRVNKAKSSDWEKQIQNFADAGIHFESAEKTIKTLRISFPNADDKDDFRPFVNEYKWQ